VAVQGKTGPGCISPGWRGCEVGCPGCNVRSGKFVVQGTRNALHAKKKEALCKPVAHLLLRGAIENPIPKGAPQPASLVSYPLGVCGFEGATKKVERTSLVNARP